MSWWKSKFVNVYICSASSIVRSFGSFFFPDITFYSMPLTFDFCNIHSTKRKLFVLLFSSSFFLFLFCVRWFVLISIVAYMFIGFSWLSLPILLWIESDTRKPFASFCVSFSQSPCACLVCFKISELNRLDVAVCTTSRNYFHLAHVNRNEILLSLSLFFFGVEMVKTLGSVHSAYREYNNICDSSTNRYQRQHQQRFT